jgi:hypothetical protein
MVAPSVAYRYRTGHWGRYTVGVIALSALIAVIWAERGVETGRLALMLVGLLTVVLVILQLAKELRAPREFRIEYGLLQIIWRSKRIVVDPKDLRIERTAWSSLFPMGAKRFRYGADSCLVFGHLAGYRDLMKRLTSLGATTGVEGRSDRNQEPSDSTT